MTKYPHFLRNTSDASPTKQCGALQEGSDTVYEAYVKKSGGEDVEIKVAADGKLIGVGKEEKDEDDD